MGQCISLRCLDSVEQHNEAGMWNGINNTRKHLFECFQEMIRYSVKNYNTDDNQEQELSLKKSHPSVHFQIGQTPSVLYWALHDHFFNPIGCLLDLILNCFLSYGTATAGVSMLEFKILFRSRNSNAFNADLVQVIDIK